MCARSNVLREVEDCLGPFYAREMGVPEPEPDIRTLRIVSSCDTAERFAAMFSRYCDETSLFIATPAPKPVGDRIRFALTLASGNPVLTGLGRVIESHDNKQNRFNRPGMRIRFEELDETSRAWVRVLSARAAAPPSPTPSAPANGGSQPAPAAATGQNARWSKPIGIPSSIPKPKDAGPAGEKPAAEPAASKPAAAKSTAEPAASKPAKSAAEPAASKPPAAKSTAEPAASKPAKSAAEPAASKPAAARPAEPAASKPVEKRAAHAPAENKPTAKEKPTAPAPSPPDRAPAREVANPGPPPIQPQTAGPSEPTAVGRVRQQTVLGLPTDGLRPGNVPLSPRKPLPQPAPPVPSATPVPHLRGPAEARPIAEPKQTDAPSEELNDTETRQILEANPLSKFDDDSIDILVDCSLYEVSPEELEAGAFGGDTDVVSPTEVLRRLEDGLRVPIDAASSGDTWSVRVSNGERAKEADAVPEQVPRPAAASFTDENTATRVSLAARRVAAAEKLAAARDAAVQKVAAERAAEVAKVAAEAEAVTAALALENEAEDSGVARGSGEITHAAVSAPAAHFEEPGTDIDVDVIAEIAVPGAKRSRIGMFAVLLVCLFAAAGGIAGGYYWARGRLPFLAADDETTATASERAAEPTASAHPAAPPVPAAVEPAPTEPVPEPATAEPAVPEPAPAVPEPAAAEPAAPEPAATAEPAGTKPASEPTPTEPATAAAEKARPTGKPEATAQPAAAKPKRQPCMLRVTSKPSNASVFINGHHEGLTPFKRVLPCGRHAVRLIYRGMQPFTRGVNLKPGKLVVVTTTLTSSAPKLNGLDTSRLGK